MIDLQTILRNIKRLKALAIGGYKIASDFGLSAAIGMLMHAWMGIKFTNVYNFECRDRLGNLKWTEQVCNLVTTQGLNDILSKYFKGSSYTATWYVGLVDNASFGSFDATNTAAKITTSTPSAPTTNDWAESSAYDESVRQTLTLGTPSAGSVSNTASKAVFTMNATKTIKGGFVISDSTKGGTSGILYGAAAFGTTRSVIDDDTITVTATLTAATA